MRDICILKHAFRVKDLSMSVEMTLDKEGHFVIMTPECSVELTLIRDSSKSHDITFLMEEAFVTS